MLRPIVHILLHAVVPATVARVGVRERWLRAAAMMLAANLIDLDHLLADPVYDPNRCSIAVHPLHSPIAIAVYAGFLLVPRARFFALGALIHIALDGIDCLWMGCF